MPAASLERSSSPVPALDIAIANVITLLFCLSVLLWTYQFSNVVAAPKYGSIRWGLPAASPVPAVDIAITNVITLLFCLSLLLWTYLFSNVVAALKYGSIRWGMPATSLERSSSPILAALDTDIADDMSWTDELPGTNIYLHIQKKYFKKTYPAWKNFKPQFRILFTFLL